MLLPELLATVRRVEVRTNRRVNAAADGARLCEPQRSRLAKHRNISECALSGEAAAGHRPALRSRPGRDNRKLARHAVSGFVVVGIAS